MHLPTSVRMWPLLIGGALLAWPLQAQDAAPTNGALAQAAATITLPALTRQVAVLTADTFWGRATPSVALRRAAQYLAAMVKNAGAANQQGHPLHVSMDSYPLPGRQVRLGKSSWLALTRTFPVITETGARVFRRTSVSFPTAARFAVPVVPEDTYRGATPPVVLLTGQPTDTFLRQASIADKRVLYVPPAELDTVTWQAILEKLYQASTGTLVLTSADSGPFTSQQDPPLYLADRSLQDNPDGVPQPWVVEVRAPAIADLLGEPGVDLAEASTTRSPAVRALPGFGISLFHSIEEADTPIAEAPQVIGLLEGSDSTLKQECTVLTAPLDQRGPLPHGAETNRAVRQADPSTVSLAGLLMLIRAFQKLPVQPKRSILFLAASGGASEQWFWGSHSLLTRLIDGPNAGDIRVGRTYCRPALSIAFDLSVGTPVTGDTAVLTGMEEVELVPSPAWVASMHPELGLTVTSGGSVVQPRSDAFAFSRRSIPSLLVQGGMGQKDSVKTGRATDVLDLERTTRLLRLVFYVSQAVSESRERPEWTATGRARIYSDR